MSTKSYHFPDSEAKIHKYQADVYHFRWPDYSSWAIFTVCDDTGEFGVQSDWGSFSYRWNTDSLGKREDGSNKSLTEFLARTSDGYVMNKFCYTKQEHTRELFDREATEKSWNEMIAENKETGWRWRENTGTPWDTPATMEKELRDDMTRFLDQADDGHPTCVDLALHDMTSRLNEFLGHEPWDHLKWRPHPWVVICRDELLPRFFAHLRDHVVPERRAAS